MYQLYHLKHRF